MASRILRSIHLQNYRSFIDAKVDLSPFTLVLGANGAGKTNFLNAFVDSALFLQNLLRGKGLAAPYGLVSLPSHFNSLNSEATISYGYDNDPEHVLVVKQMPGRPAKQEPGSIELFRLNPDKISARETVVRESYVSADGSGTTQCLESLKNGDREELFDAAEQALISYVPEIERLSFATTEAGTKELQVRERGIKNPIPASQLSDGTRLIIALLAIIYQQVKPPVICLEDVDRGMHPRVFEQLVKLMQRLAREAEVNIIATTHNPYLVDCFQDDPNAVVVVEKKDGASSLATLGQKLEILDYKEAVDSDMPLGNLWFSGFVGGVPEFLRPRRK